MSDFKHLLPPSATPSARAVEVVMAERIQGLDEPIGKLWNVDTCPEALLPWLAWSFSVEVWDHAWPVETKRAVIRKSILVHRWKGTRRSVEEALEAIGFEADIREWFEVDGVELARAPGTFEVTTIFPEDADLGGDGLARSVDAAKRVINATKPVSAHYGFHIGQKIKGAKRLGASAFGRMVDTRTPRVEASAEATRQPRAALIGHIRTSATSVAIGMRRRPAVAIFGKLEAV
ncbi:phage tail protein I [Phaeobacter inhibens]|uniref:phage tail protein I n=1 Tax=Phaeobacter inhibens TaxID=221822 RepID=UPI000C9A1020|nr:phage tail protein I [Phaeobacter inhibens]AUQ62332.1 phage tail protein I [Phaeobacter inhibens]AUQ91346.1 phage tail protein I [Phaeobacter inhibens]